MGFIVILPFAVLAVWSIFAIFRWLRRGDFGDQWWRAFAILSAVGIALGVCFAFVVHYKVANVKLAGFPIPSAITTRQTPADPWVESAMPAVIRLSVLVTDFLCGVALCLAPIAIAAFFKESKAKNLFSFPRPEAPPPP